MGRLEAIFLMTLGFLNSYLFTFAASFSASIAVL